MISSTATLHPDFGGEQFFHIPPHGPTHSCDAQQRPARADRQKPPGISTAVPVQSTADHLLQHHIRAVMALSFIPGLFALLTVVSYVSPERNSREEQKGFLRLVLE